ncbi:MAG: site-specific integrase [Verrucomicrobia bacterium]|nr:site-specific integrase [Verrucomicrobiota bacterium]
MKANYRIKPYAHDRLKWVVRGKENGKWTRKFFEKKVEAETYAQIKNTELLNQGMEGVSFPAALRVMALECEKRLAEFGKSLRDATDFYIPHLQRSQRAVALRGVVDEVLSAKAAKGIKVTTLKVYGHRVKQFAADFPDRSINSIMADEIEKWLLAKFPHPVTRNNNRRVIVNLFNFAKTKKYVESNPVLEIETASERPGEVGILRPEQVTELLSHATPEILPYFAIGAFAGIRPEEMLKLEWADIKMKQGIIRVRAEVSKVGKARNVTMETNLKEWLVPSLCRKGKVCPSNWRRLFRETRIQAGVTEWPSDCLRHSFATYWLEKYKDAPRLALEMGNSVSVILEHYHKVLDEPQDAERYWQIKPGAVSKKVVSFSA